MKRFLGTIALFWLSAVFSLGGEPAQPPKPPPLRTLIETRLAATQKATGIDKATREKALNLYDEALRQLDAAEASRRQSAGFQALAAAAPAAVAEAKTHLQALSAKTPEAPPKNVSLDGAQKLLDTARQKLRAATESLAEVKEKTVAWQERRLTLPDQLREAETRLSTVRQEAAIPPPKPSDVVGQAAGLARRARQLAAEADVQRLEHERASFEATGPLLPVQQEVGALEERQLKEEVRLGTVLVERLNRRGAEQDLQRAREAVENADDPTIKTLADQNLKLTNRRVGAKGIVPQLEETNRETAAARKQLEALKASHASAIERLKVAGMTNTMGMLLRKHKGELPDIRRLPRRIRARQGAMADVQLDLIRLGEDRDRQLTVEEQLRVLLSDLEPDSARYARVALETRLREMLVQQRAILKALFTDANAYFNALVELDALERQLIAEAKAFTEFIDEHVLWIRSARILEPADAGRAIGALGWLLGSGWGDIVKSLWNDLLANSPITIPALLLFVALLIARRRLRRQLHECSEKATDSRTATYRLTLQSLFCTIGIAAPWPALLLFFSWRLGTTHSGTDLAAAVAYASERTALFLIPLSFFVQTLRVRGLGGAHFHWPAKAIEQGQRVAFLWAVTVLPLLFVVVVLEHQTNEAYKSSLGRFTFMAAALLTAVVLFALLRKNSPVLAIAAKSSGGVVLWTRWLWFPVILGAPPLLALAAAVGFEFTAIHLFRKLLATFLLVLGLVIVQELILRWLYLVQLRLALEERDRRMQKALEEQRQRQEQEALGDDMPEMTAVAPIQKSGVSFDDLRHQTRALLRWSLATVGILGLYVIWADVLPALGILRQFVLWGQPVQAGGTGQVTAADLMLAILTVAAAFIAARNLPAVLEMILLRHLPMDSGTRYAATTIVRYAVTVVGVVFVAVFVGIRWTSVQWLIAALTVGLGFGLQEIFANFISGLILLFERPIRIGDTVTIGDVIGTVTRIRIRATTITDWERKELVVPNREFITGRLINWTLSDDVIRAQVCVGIAYGSDTAKVRELMIQAALENRRVLEEPPPLVLFQAFGASSLDFELRVFVRGVQAFRLVHSELNLRIDELFREAGIEIAFPQQDLHIRSVSSPTAFLPPREDPAP